MIYFILFLIVIIMMILIPCVRVVPQGSAYVIERLGTFSCVWEAGIHVLIPFLDSVRAKVDLREQVLDFPPSSVITKDNVNIEVDTVVYMQIMDPKLYTYGVADPIGGVRNLVATNLRNIFGSMELDRSLSSRDEINTRMQVVIDAATDPWGLRITRTELKNLEAPRSIQEAMEKQMKAERERREKILRAEGEKESTILVAEGRKQAAILEAKAKREAMIEEAQGQAEAIRTVQQATAEGLRYLKEAELDQEVLQLKAIEAFGKAADGQATKIIIPSEIQGIVGLAEGLSAGLKK